ncbi:MAG: aldehyde dehydrogenase [Gammaproteobacteria bacterium]|nr:aldehyde dehydrogenase [Gammaproteobacteria bacterium]
MSDLLTQADYEAIAAQLDFPTTAYIDGRAQAADSGDTFASVNPATGETIAELSISDAAQVDHAVLKAREAFADGRWSKLDPDDRKAVLVQLSKLIKRNARELAVLESLESGKPIADIETVDIPEAIACLLWHAESIDKIYDQVAPAGDDVVAMVVREPIGVVGCVLPWNFPILMLAWKIAPALAAGNSVIVKPAEETSMTALRIAELASRAGLPRGVLNVLPGPGEITGRLLGLHGDVDMVSFTGSTEIGKLFLNYAADSNMKRIVLECGGKNPCVVLDDAENLDVVAQHVCNAVMWNMGENCSANSRLIVQQSIADDLLLAIGQRLKEWNTGDPLNPHNQLGAIVSQDQFERIMGFIEAGKKEGATLHIGGTGSSDNGLYIEPTVFTDVTPQMSIAREEIFGPVLSIITVKSIDEAIAVANDSCYGLAASVFTSNLKNAHRLARAIRAGTVTVNTYGEGNMATPFGGYKQSGFGGRDNSLHAHDQYTELKTIWIDISDQSVDALS